MATKIIHKKSSTASSVPVAGDLEPGELAVNLADKKLYTKTVGGTVIELGSTPASVREVTASTTLVLTDANNIVEANVASAHAITIPTNASVAYAIGTIISITMKGAGVTTITASAGVTLNGTTAGSEAMSSIWDGVSIYKNGTDSWVIQGAIGGSGGGGMSDAEVKTAYENNADTNAFNDAAVTKLAGIDTGAKDDQTGAEIKSAYEGETNAFTDTKNTKLTNIEDNATADQTNAEIRTAVGDATDSNVYNDAAVTKLGGVEDLADVTDAGNVDTAGAIMDSDVSAGEGHLRKTGAGAYVAMKTNIGAVVAPGVTDDGVAGYAVGSQWIDTTADKEYVCLDITTGVAVWTETTGGGSGMSDAEVKTAYENNADTNEFNDAEKTKLGTVDTNAADDQTGAEIKSAYQAEANAFTDTKNTKLTGIDTGAKDDQTGTEIKTAYEAETNAFTDAQFTKLAGIDTDARDDQTGAEIKSAYQGEANAFTDGQFTKLAGIDTGAKDDQTGAEIKSAYESEANAYTDTKDTKLGTIEDSADVTDAENVTAAGAAMLGGSGITVGSTHLNKQTGTTYSLVAGDNGKTVILTNAASIVLTVSGGLGVGFRCTVIQGGAGQVTMTPGGVTVNSLLGYTKIAGQNGIVGLLATSSNIFTMAGDLVA